MDPADLLRHRLSLPDDKARIVTVVQWASAPSVARSYRRGRVFLAGRAAHQAEPTGRDVDTCIGDAVDLGWRLAAAVHGWAGIRPDQRVAWCAYGAPSACDGVLDEVAGARQQLYENT